MLTKSDLSICIYDHRAGSYLNVAMCLHPYFRKTYYHSSCADAYPHPALSSIGDGFEEFERIDDFWQNLDLFDIIVFPDGNNFDTAQALRKMGKLVFGGSQMEKIEEGRDTFNQLLERANLPVPKSQTVRGFSNLSKALRNKKDKWIKISKWRNLVETYHWIDWQSSKFWLEELSHRLGPIKDKSNIEFIIQDPIDSITEIGCDGYTLNGQTADSIIVGIEAKDAGYVGKVTKDIPKPVSQVNQFFKPILSSFKAQGFYSTEIRVLADGTPFYVDICARAGSPPSSSYLKNINNWNEIIPGIASGQWVEPTYKKIYMVELILKSGYATDNFLPISFPEEFTDNITLKGATKVDGQLYIVPFSYVNVQMEEFGSVVVQDDDLDYAIAKCLEIASQVKAYELRYEQVATDTIKEQLDEVEQALNWKFRK